MRLQLDMTYREHKIRRRIPCDDWRNCPSCGHHFLGAQEQEIRAKWGPCWVTEHTVELAGEIGVLRGICARVNKACRKSGVPRPRYVIGWDRVIFIWPQLMARGETGQLVDMGTAVQGAVGSKPRLLERSLLAKVVIDSTRKISLAFGKMMANEINMGAEDCRLQEAVIAWPWFKHFHISNGGRESRKKLPWLTWLRIRERAQADQPESPIAVAFALGEEDMIHSVITDTWTGRKIAEKWGVWTARDCFRIFFEHLAAEREMPARQASPAYLDPG